MQRSEILMAYIKILQDLKVVHIPSSQSEVTKFVYAITTHKAQGSQFRRVVVPVVPSRLLDRMLLYTAMTRAQEQIVFVGERTAFREAISARPTAARRDAGLGEHLKLSITGAFAQM